MHIKDKINFQLQDALMEVEDQIAAQAPTNVGKGKEIATVMLTVLATWNAVMTIAILPLDLVLSLTAAMFLQAVSN